MLPSVMGLNRQAIHQLFIKCRDQRKKRKADYTETEKAIDDVMDACKARARQLAAEEGVKTVNFGSEVGSVIVEEKPRRKVKVNSGDDLVNWVLEDPANRIHVLQARASEGKVLDFLDAGIAVPGIYVESEIPVQFKGATK